jgi:hypothetical protein
MANDIRVLSLERPAAVLATPDLGPALRELFAGVRAGTRLASRLNKSRLSVPG